MSTKTVTKKAVSKFSKKTMDEDVQAYVAMALAMIGDNLKTDDLKEFANATHLSLATLYRLSYGWATSECRVSTLQKLAAASGLKLTFSGGRGRLSLTR